MANIRFPTSNMSKILLYRKNLIIIGVFVFVYFKMAS